MPAAGGLVPRGDLVSVAAPGRALHGAGLAGLAARGRPEQPEQAPAGSGPADQEEDHPQVGVHRAHLQPGESSRMRRR